LDHLNHVDINNFRGYLCLVPGGLAEYQLMAPILTQLIALGKLDPKQLIWIVEPSVADAINAGPLASSLLFSYAASTTLRSTRIVRLMVQARRRHPYTIVHVGSFETHAAAAFAKSVWGLPIVLFRSWSLPEIVRSTRLNHLLNNKITDINLLHSKPLVEWHCQPQEGNRLRIHNSYLIDDQDALEQARRLEYCYRASVIEREHQQRSRPDFSNIELTYVTHFYFNQENINAVTDLLREYEGYAPKLLDRVMFVVVDDGSPVDYEVPSFNINLIWLKINEDVAWNQAGARNLGATYAPSEKLLLSDLDHSIPEATMRYLVERKSPGKIIYKLRRLDPNTGRRMKGHPNLFFMTRSRFFRYFGYDEEFAGNYGFEDARFIKFQKLQGTLHWHLPKHIVAQPRRNIDKDKGYHSLRRDLSGNLPVYVRKKYETSQFGHSNGHSRSFLNFTWSVLSRQTRATRSLPTIDRRWKRRWLLRQIAPWL
jgi:hypothetical protein